MKPYSRDVLRSPEQMVTNGKCLMGTFNEPFKVINLLDLEKPLGKKLPRFVNNLRLKEWEAFQIASEDYFICLAVYTAKIVDVAFVLIYDKRERKLYTYARQSPPLYSKVPSGLYHSTCTYNSTPLTIEIQNRLDKEMFEISFQAKAFGDHPACEGRITAFHNTEPIVIVQPFGENRPLYSHKALMPGNGFLDLGERTVEFENGKTAVIVDDHKGYYPYVNFYDWVTTLGYREGKLIGFNLTDNQVQNPEKYNENCLWKKGKMIPLPPIKVNRPEGLRNMWEIRDKYGRVNLTFTPICAYQFKRNLGIISSSYYGPVGSFNGYVLDDNNERVNFDNFVGMGEKRSDRI